MTAPVCRRVGPLTARKRKNLPRSAFGLPNERKYPIPDPKHAAAAKGRALTQLERDNLSIPEYQQIVSRANAVIARCQGALAGLSGAQAQTLGLVFLGGAGLLAGWLLTKAVVR